MGQSFPIPLGGPQTGVSVFGHGGGNCGNPRPIPTGSVVADGKRPGFTPGPIRLFCCASFRFIPDPNRMKLKPFLLSALLVPATTALQAETLFELLFPYASEWTHPVYGGLGNGAGDFDLDGKVNDLVRGATFGSPESEEYKTHAKFTEPGPTFMMRAMAAGLDTDASNEAPFVGGHGVTRQSFRLEATRDKSPKYARMGYAGWILFPAANFSKEKVGMGDALLAEANVDNAGELSLRLLVKAQGTYYVSKTVSKGDLLQVTDLAAETWIEYKQAEKGRSLRVIPSNGGEKSGKVLGALEGIGLYVEKAEYNGLKGENPRLELKQLRLVTK